MEELPDFEPRAHGVPSARRQTAGPVTLLVVGAGSRGTAFADYALRHAGEAKAVAVAEP